MARDRIGADLPDWIEYAKSEPWNSVLVGNGASRAIWDDFKYDSLFTVAQSAAVKSRLTREDEQIFFELGKTRNFEAVLGALITARTVCNALAIPVGRIEIGT